MFSELVQGESCLVLQFSLWEDTKVTVQFWEHSRTICVFFYLGFVKILICTSLFLISVARGLLVRFFSPITVHVWLGVGSSTCRGNVCCPQSEWLPWKASLERPLVSSCTPCLLPALWSVALWPPLPLLYLLFISWLLFAIFKLAVPSLFISFSLVFPATYTFKSDVTSGLQLFFLISLQTQH